MEPRFINIEYIFNRVYDIFLWIKYIVLFKIGDTTVEGYLADHKDASYDGLRDRFMIEQGDPFSGWGKEVIEHTSDGTAHTVTEPDSPLTSVFHKILEAFGFQPDTSAATLASGVQAGGTPVDSFFLTFLGGVRDGMTVIAIIAIGIYIYTTIRWKEVGEAYDDLFEKSHKKQIKTPAASHTKWSLIEKHIEGQNEAEWRLAILEADTILFELLKTLGVEGKDLGEKLSSVNRAQFRTLDDAWEAHKVRNKIAHEGSDFRISEKLARDTIARYKNVCTEFNFFI